ncbi:MAG: hypothetical protein KDK56_06610 [Simkania sp.]|nr:hypothetical protein [Simkania sp.]MCB1074411.1 hypothetical protein [Simkania sp.]MCP5489533.1 hypothetical protein [Chlamydiales bacterium]
MSAINNNNRNWWIQTANLEGFDGPVHPKDKVNEGPKLEPITEVDEDSFSILEQANVEQKNLPGKLEKKK